MDYIKDNFDYKKDLYNILDAIPTSVFWKDMAGKYIGCNKYMCDLVGMSREEIIGKTDKDLLWTNESDNLHLIDELVINNKAKYEVEETVKVSNSETNKIFLSTKTPLYNSKNEVVGIIGVSTNITDRKKTEDMRLKKEVAEKTANFAKNIAGSIAHELKNPLATISMCVDRMTNELKDSRSLKDKEKFLKREFGIIKSVVYSVNHVINDILHKIRSFSIGSIDKSKEKNNVLNILNKTIKEYPFSKEENKIISMNNVKRTNFIFEGNRDLLKHVFSNLIKNSIRAIKETSKEGKINIEFDDKEEKFNFIFFKDNGCGVDKKDMEIIFNHYETKHPHKGGTGLGLYFCKMMMNSVGGDIVCESVVGEYTLFTLSFPKI